MAQQGKTSKKIKRGLGQNLSYKAEHRHEKGHFRRLVIHMKRYGWAQDAEAALLKYAQNINLAATNTATAFLKNAKALKLGKTLAQQAAMKMAQGA